MNGSSRISRANPRISTEIPVIPEIPPLPKRTSTLRRKKPPGPNPFTEDVEKPPETGKKEEKPTVAASQSAAQNEGPEISAQKQPFWKFHVLRFGTCLYLSTNPTLRHLYCRNAPGYFVRISGKSLGYTMVFEDIETGEPFVKIEKFSDRQSDHFTFHVLPKRVIENGIVKNIDEFEEPKGINEVPSTQKDANSAPSAFLRQDLLAKNPLFRDLSGQASDQQKLPQKAPDSDVTSPIEDWTEAFSGTLVWQPIPERLLPIAPVTPMVNYAGKMIDNQTWNLGSLPRYRESRMNPQDTKYIAKKNVYFHHNFTDIDRYFEWDVPPAMAVFRECESRSKKRAMRQINRLSRMGSISSKQLPSEVEASPYSEITSYYKSGDGVYFDKVPADDEPDHHHKLGWVSVYEDAQAFSKRGMFDLVVALTVAIGYERNLRFGESDNEAV